MFQKSKNTKTMTFDITRGNPAKQAGSNKVAISVRSEDWRVSEQTINMSIRDAQVLRRFLNNYLES